MKRYVWAYVSLFDHELKMGILEAESEFDALKKMNRLGQPDLSEADSDSMFEGATTVDEIHQIYVDCDTVAGVMELK